MVDLASQLELAGERRINRGVAAQTQKLYQTWDVTCARVRQTIERVQALEQEIANLEHQAARQQQVVNGGDLMIEGVENAMVASMNAISEKDQKVLDLTAEQRMLLVGTIALAAERAQRRLVNDLRKTSYPKGRESNDNYLFKAAGPRGCAAEMGYTLDQIMALEKTKQLADVCVGNAPFKPLGQKLSLTDVGLSPDHAQVMRKAIAPPPKK